MKFKLGFLLVSIGWLLMPLFFLIISCGLSSKSRCDMPQDFIIEEAKMFANITETSPIIHENELQFELIKRADFSPQQYTCQQFLKFPLPASVESLSFLVKGNAGLVLDTLYITYEVTSKMYQGDLCNDPQLIPQASNKRCVSTNHFFKVISYQ